MTTTTAGRTEMNTSSIVEQSNGQTLNFRKYANEFTSTLHKNIAREIVHEAWERFNVTVEDDLSLWLVKLFSISPSKYVRVNTSFEQADIDNLIGKCLEIISDPNDTFVTTLKLQIYYMKHQIDDDSIIGNYTTDLQAKMSALTRAIVGTSLRTKNQCEDYLKKIAVDTIVQYSLGDPSKSEVIGETINALKSVMSTNDIMKFSLLPEQEKRESIAGLRDIICGIRIFNKDAGHCGEGLIDMEETIRNGCVATKLQLTNTKKDVKECIRLLLLFLDYKESDQTFTEAQHNIVKLIILYRQCQQMHDELFHTLLDVQVNCDRLLINFRNCLTRIHNTVKYRTAIAIEHIFPKFIELAKIWQQLEYKLIIMSEINTVNEQLMLLSNVVAKRDEIATKLMERGDSADIESKLTNIERSADGNGISGADNKIIANTSTELISVVMAHQEKMKLEYNGFCAWTLCAANGLLLPADTSIGIICYKNRYYGFTSIDAANKFQENVNVWVDKNISLIEFIKNRPIAIHVGLCRCLQHIRDVIHGNPELAILLDVYRCSSGDELAKFGDDHSPVGLQSITSSMHCVEIQTETHPIPYHKDEHYTWNKWDLRRKAIKLADIQQSRTHSTQTAISFHRHAFGTQTYGESDNSNQTDQDVKTQTDSICS